MPKISKMSKPQLYEHCKKLQEELNKEKLFNDDNKSLKEENEALKEANASYEDLLGGDDGTIDKIEKLQKEIQEYKTECCKMEDKLVKQQQSYEDLKKENEELIKDKIVYEGLVQDLEEDIKTWKKDHDKLIKEHLKLQKIEKSSSKYINIVENHSATIHNDHICRKDTMDKSKFNSIDKDRLKKMIEVDSRENCAMWNYTPYLKLLLEQTELKEKYGREADDFEEENKKLKKDNESIKEEKEEAEEMSKIAMVKDLENKEDIEDLKKENEKLKKDIKDLKNADTSENSRQYFKNLIFDNLCDISNPHDVCDSHDLDEEMIEFILKDIHARFMDIRSLC